jgi:hypothetical protein
MDDIAVSSKPLSRRTLRVEKGLAYANGELSLLRTSNRL